MSGLAEVELFVHPHSIEVWVNKQRIVSFGIHDERVQFWFNELVEHRVDLVDGLDRSLLDLLDTYTLVIEREEYGMALPRPRIRKEPVTTRHFDPVVRTRREKASGLKAVDTIAELSRDSVLRDILDSMIDNPDQSLAERRAETRRIALKHSERMFAVAGVRAALTKGIYGDADQLIIARRRQRRRERASE